MHSLGTCYDMFSLHVPPICTLTYYPYSQRTSRARRKGQLALGTTRKGSVDTCVPVLEEKQKRARSSRVRCSRKGETVLIYWTLLVSSLSAASLSVHQYTFPGLPAEPCCPHSVSSARVLSPPPSLYAILQTSSLWSEPIPRRAQYEIKPPFSLRFSTLCRKSCLSVPKSVHRARTAVVQKCSVEIHDTVCRLGSGRCHPPKNVKDACALLKARKRRDS